MFDPALADIYKVSQTDESFPDDSVKIGEKRASALSCALKWLKNDWYSS